MQRWMRGVAVVAMAVRLASVAEGARPWPILVRTYWSRQAGPAAIFELDRDGRTWRGVPGDRVPGTDLQIRLVSFLPSGVVLCDTDRRIGVPVLVQQSPWYQLAQPIADQAGPLPHPEGEPEPPPRPGTAADFAEMAREYTFAQRYSEAAVCEARAQELGASQTIVSGDVAYRLTKAAELGESAKISIHKTEEEAPRPAPVASPSPDASAAPDASESPAAAASPGASPSPGASVDPYAPPPGN